MATVVKTKGTALLQEISSVYTAIPQLRSVSVTGRASETTDIRILDGNAVFSRASTGFASPATINFEVYFDPDDTTHQAFDSLTETPANTNFKVTYADATPTNEIYAGVGFTLDKNAASASEMLMASGTIVCSGASS